MHGLELKVEGLEPKIQRLGLEFHQDSLTVHSAPRYTCTGVPRSQENVLP